MLLKLFQFDLELEFSRIGKDKSFIVYILCSRKTELRILQITLVKI